jgi:hypothetical protein
LYLTWPLSLLLLSLFVLAFKSWPSSHLCLVSGFTIIDKYKTVQHTAIGTQRKTMARQHKTAQDTMKLTSVVEILPTSTLFSSSTITGAGRDMFAEP